MLPHCSALLSFLHCYSLLLLYFGQINDDDDDDDDDGVPLAYSDVVCATGGLLLGDFGGNVRAVYRYLPSCP